MKLKNGRFLRITELYAFVSKDKDGNEGIIGMTQPDGTWMPFVGADTERVDSLIPIANKICKITGVTYEIRHFKQII